MNSRLFLGGIVALCGNVSAQSVFFDTYPDAAETVAGVYENMDELQKLPNEKGKIIFSIVAPEVAMYSGFIDELETVSAEVFYTNFGKEYGNFSVGQFQMKPSFAEDIERAYREECEACTHLETIEYKGLEDESEIRSVRLDRLKMDTWQQVYLLCFYEVMEARHGAKIMTTKERTAFYASAYNLGFNRPVADIEEWIGIPSFPGNMQEKLVSYGDLAGDFLLVLRPDLESETIEEARLSADFKGEGMAGHEEDKIFKTDPVDFKKENNRVRILPYLFVITGFVLLLLIWLRFKKRAAQRQIGTRVELTSKA